MPPLLTIVVENVFVFDDDVEALQSIVDISVSDVGVVGLDTFELLKEFDLVTDRDAELLDVALLMIREFCIIGV